MTKVSVALSLLVLLTVQAVDEVSGQEAGNSLTSTAAQQQPALSASTLRVMEEMHRVVADWEEEKDKAALPYSETTKKYRAVLRESQTVGHEDFLALAERMMNIAKSDPRDVGSRDALLWVVLTGHPAKHNDVRQRAVSMLLEHHANDVEASRATLSPVAPSAVMDTLLVGLVEKATVHEAKGMARITLAEYLKLKADWCNTYTTGFLEGATNTRFGSDYLSYLRECDLDAVRDRTESLLEQVIAEYGEIPYIRPGRFGASDSLRKRSIGQRAKDLLDEIRNLAIGEAAPPIEGLDLNGEPLRLTDYRGKVVALVFWASWCAPCMREIPFERELARRLADKPFALLGVNCDVDLDTARSAADSAQVTWPSWHDGFPTPIPGPIVERYHVNSLPAVFLLDANGVIRSKGARRDYLEETVLELLDELDGKPPHVSQERQLTR